MPLIKEYTADRLIVKIFDNRNSMGEEAAKMVGDKIRKLLYEKDCINIIFAAAPSQNEFLASLISQKDIEWHRINAFHMDEYIGLEKDAPQGFGNFLRHRLFDKVNFRSVNYINGNAEDVNDECERYSTLLKQFPPDIVCMGIGENGHIAFNDPHVAFFNDTKLVKVVELDSMCREQQVNDGCFDSIEKVPTHAITLTIPALISAEFIYCMVPAKTKANAVLNTVMGEISESCPASILRKHRSAVLFLDVDSADKILNRI